MASYHFVVHSPNVPLVTCKGVRATPSPLNPTPAEPRCTRLSRSIFHRNVELTKSKALARYRHIGICLIHNVPRKSVANCTRRTCRVC